MQDKIIKLLMDNETETLCGEYFLVKRKHYGKLANEIEIIFSLNGVSKRTSLTWKIIALFGIGYMLVDLIKYVC